MLEPRKEIIVLFWRCKKAEQDGFHLGRIAPNPYNKSTEPELHDAWESGKSKSYVWSNLSVVYKEKNDKSLPKGVINGT